MSEILPENFTLSPFVAQINRRNCIEETGRYKNVNPLREYKTEISLCFKICTTLGVLKASQAT